MGGEISYFEGLARDSDVDELCFALDEIAGGIIAFPEIYYVPVWKAWFRYLLPDLIIQSNGPDNVNFDNTTLITKTVVGCFSVYPAEITEEYPGFRDDILSTLGTRIMPPSLARETTPDEDQDSFFADIWNIEYDLELDSRIGNSILFCIKYLSPSEITGWVASLFQIQSPQWYFQLMFSLRAWRKLLSLAENAENEPENLQGVIRTSGMFGEYWVPPYKSFDEFISPDNVLAFNRAIAEHLSLDLFENWKEEILSALNQSAYDIENHNYLRNLFQVTTVRRLEEALFPTPPR
jgi:hypothetical protein